MSQAMGESLKQFLIPAMTSTTSRMTKLVAAQFRSEILQSVVYDQQEDPSDDYRIRKELEPPASTEPLLQGILSSVADLQRHVAMLSEQLAQANPPQPAAPREMTQQQPPSPQSLPRPTASQLEDIFLAALGVQSTGATLQLVNDHMPFLNYCLPQTPNASPLSQAVLLTLLHRVSRCFSLVSVLC